MIEVTNLVKRYGNHTAVDQLSFTVEDGQIYGFLGPNGAGKSTTMNIMTGYLAATEGQVLINGHDIMEEPAEAKKCIGYLPEMPPLYQDMTVYEYLKFVAELKKLPKKDIKGQIAAVMEKVKISEMADRLIKNLSKGYKQRVGLAQAILGDPEIIILDEPTVGLDPKQIIEIRDLIKSLGKKHTVILSSHILSEVSAVCDHIMIISHGKLAASDTPENLIKLTSASTDIRLEIKGEMNQLKEALRDISGVDYVECNQFDKVSKQGTYTVHVKDTQDMNGKPASGDVREAIFYKMVECNAPILEMVTTTKSLEDVFLELTKDEPVKMQEDDNVSSAGDDRENEAATQEISESAEDAQEVDESAEDAQKVDESAEDAQEVDENETDEQESAQSGKEEA